MRQPALPGLAPEDDEGALRRAYERVPGLKRTRTLEEALAVPALRTGLRRMAALEAERRTRKGRG